MCSTIHNATVRMLFNEINHLLKHSQKYDEIEIRPGHQKNGRYQANIENTLWTKICQHYGGEKRILFDTIYQKTRDSKIVHRKHFLAKNTKTMDLKLENFILNNTQIQTEIYAKKKIKTKTFENTLRYSHCTEKPLCENLDFDDEKDVKYRLQERISYQHSDCLKLDMSQAWILRQEDTSDAECIIEIEFTKSNLNEIEIEEAKKFVCTLLNSYFHLNEPEFVCTYQFSLYPYHIDDQQYLPEEIERLSYEQYCGELYTMRIFDKKILFSNLSGTRKIERYENNSNIELGLILGFLKKNFFFLIDILLFKEHNSELKDMRSHPYSFRFNYLKKIKLSRIAHLSCLVKEDQQITINDEKIKLKNLVNKWNLQSFDSQIICFSNSFVYRYQPNILFSFRVEYRKNYCYFHHGTSNARSRKWGSDKTLFYLPIKFRNKKGYYGALFKRLIKSNLGEKQGDTFCIGFQGEPDEKTKAKEDIGLYTFSIDQKSWIFVGNDTDSKDKAEDFCSIKKKLEIILDRLQI